MYHGPILSLPPPTTEESSTSTSPPPSTSTATAEKASKEVSSQTEAPVFAGCIGLTPKAGIAHIDATLGFWLGRIFWSQGVLSDLLPPFLRFCFHSDGILERVTAEVVVGNGASSRVLEKAGFAREVMKRRAVKKGGNVEDLEIWGMLRGEVLGKEVGE